MAGLLGKLKGIGKKKDADSSVPKDTPLPTDGGSPVEGGGTLPPGVTAVGGENHPQGVTAASGGPYPAGSGGLASPETQAKLLEIEAKTMEIDALKEQLGTIDDKSKSIEVKLAETEKITKKSKEKIDEIDKNMKKFLSLYEMVTNQINPFVDSKVFERSASNASLLDSMQEVAPPAPVIEEEYVVEEEPIKVEEPLVPKAAPDREEAETVGEQEIESSLKSEEGDDVLIMEAVHHKDNSLALKLFASMVNADEAKEKKSAILKSLVDLGWITPRAHADISKELGADDEEEYEIEGQDVGEEEDSQLPLPPVSSEELENLAPLMKWIDGLTDKVGVDGTTDILKYLVKLGWVTPDAHEELLNYIAGDKSMITGPGGQGGPALIPLDEYEKTSEKEAMAQSWMRYLLDKVGEDGAKEVLSTYIEFGWVTKKAYTQLSESFGSFDEIDRLGGDLNYDLSSADHATSLFFISRIKGMDDAEYVYKSIERILAQRGFSKEGDSVNESEKDGDLGFGEGLDTSDSLLENNRENKRGRKK
ncbi:MAG: FlaD/FlaE family flagellar protein [Candidatus Altiarchaeota archaeon]